METSKTDSAAVDNRSEAIAVLNDAFRRAPLPHLGKVVMTHGVAALAYIDRMKVLAFVHHFKAFTPDNDPYGEHDFGAFEYDGNRYFWKIDYYDASYESGSPDPGNVELTQRVLTVMFASEY